MTSKTEGEVAWWVEQVLDPTPLVLTVLMFLMGNAMQERPVVFPSVPRIEDEQA